MFRRIGNLLAKDLLYSRRESILVYSITGMLLLAVGMLFFLPSLEQMDIFFVVDDSVPPEVARQLEAYGQVEYYANLHRLRERVLEFDDVPGIYYAGGEYVVLLEGNLVVSLKLEEDDENRLRQLAKKRGVKYSDLITSWVKEHLRES